VLPALPNSTVLARKGEAIVISEVELSKRIAANDTLVLVVLMVVAVLLGLTLLWARGEAWGGFEDYLTAFLWGFGLHQVGNKPFEGLLGLRDAMIKSGA
jgi:hypothetical protein